MRRLFAAAGPQQDGLGIRVNLKFTVFCLFAAAMLILEGCSTTPARLPAVPPD